MIKGLCIICIDKLVTFGPYINRWRSKFKITLHIEYDTTRTLLIKCKLCNGDYFLTHTHGIYTRITLCGEIDFNHAYNERWISYAICKVHTEQRFFSKTIKSNPQNAAKVSSLKTNNMLHVPWEKFSVFAVKKLDGTYIENTRWVSFDIKFTRQGFENACCHREDCRNIDFKVLKHW